MILKWTYGIKLFFIGLLIQVLNSGAFSVSHPSSQALLGANLATGPVLKEHLPAYSYSQTGYSAIPQGHIYTPSALQQTYLDGNVFHTMSHTTEVPA